LSIFSSEAPEIKIQDESQLFDKAFVAALCEILPDVLCGSRWYRDKTRTIAVINVLDVIVFENARSYVVVVKVGYQEGEPQLYVLAFSIAWDGANQLETEAARSIVATVKTVDGTEGVLYDAFWNGAFRDSVFRLIENGRSLRGLTSELVASQTSAFRVMMGAARPRLESVVSSAEQSNTSLIFGDRFILKVFRKLEQGMNPDLEIGSFLTERGFTHTPAIAGSIEYTPPHGEPAYFAILQQFVPNKGDAWRYTLDSLGGFFRSVLSGRELPTLGSYHPMTLASQELPAQAGELIGSYLDSARLLGERTAQMHATLADENAGPGFAPERFAFEHKQELYRSMEAQVDTAFRLLRQEESKLHDAEREDVDKVLSSEQAIRNRSQALLHRDISAGRIRHHGDFHLGQVLYTGTDFVIIDFEGEPARPLPERRRKGLALRDVAGMIRSFQYAAYAALFGKVPGVSVYPGQASIVEGWAAWWTAYVSAEYLKAYFATASHLSFVPASEEERRQLLDVFLLQKALYEVAYELNNRPAWVRIPLRGILTLLA
jgi:maltose alpha-D-glucosyltransferase / alpha-amylase